MQIKIVTTLQTIPKEQWSQLIGSSFPFSEYEYLLTMENTGCVGRQAGWLPHYLTAWDNNCLVGAIFLYVKDNSYGEYIFDWNWAHSYHTNGIPYYPKLVSAIPFTPATGRKLLLHPNAPALTGPLLIQQALEFLKETRCSSLHFLFIPFQEISIFESMRFLIRHSYQFHWKNQGYSSFEDFVSHLKRKKRKEILRERRIIHEQSIEITVLTGEALTREHSQIMYDFYLSTIHKMGAIPYLSSAFYEKIFQTMKQSIVLILAKSAGKWVAGSVNYHKGDCLYGRYWGCLEEFKHLHFELCYYQTIDYAIAHQIRLFEAGAQGEHKIQRGFLPELTYSAHYIVHPEFQKAITQFLEREKMAILRSIEDNQDHMPYKKSALD